MSEETPNRQYSDTLLGQTKAQPNDGQQSISKNQEKRLLKRQRYLQLRPERRKLEKERKKAKKLAELIEREASGGQVRDDFVKRRTLMSDSRNKFKVVVDMDFEDFMTESEIAKATKQLGRIYSLNRHSENPCQLYITSLRGKIRDRMSITNKGFENWDVHCSELNYLDLFKQPDCVVEESDFRKKFIYLSGDAEYTLPDVDELLKDESKIFIIGGLVDHNRHKNLCHKRATELGIKTAKLPLKEHIKLTQRHILSTFAVFEILLHVFGSQKSWLATFNIAIPKRKIASPDSDNDLVDRTSIEEGNAK